jgi:ketosteroid isomerase-like protein
MAAGDTAEQRRQITGVLFEAINARQPEAIEEFLDEDFEMHSLFAPVEGGTVYRGADGLIKLLASLDATWNDFGMHLDDVVDSGDKSVVLYNVKGSARASGIPLDEEVAMIWTWRGDRIAEARTYISRDEALRSAGVEGF